MRAGAGWRLLMDEVAGCLNERVSCYCMYVGCAGVGIGVECASDHDDDDNNYDESVVGPYVGFGKTKALRC